MAIILAFEGIEMEQKTIGSLQAKELQSNENFDKVNGIEIKRPELVDPGLNTETGNLVNKSQLNETAHTFIVADMPNFRKDIGISMADEGFIKLPRSLLKSEVWKSLRLRQQKLFLYILEKAQFNHYVFKYNGKDIPLAPGELCNSYRGLAEDFNQTVKYRDEKIDASFVQRAVSTFFKSGLTDTRTDTGILVISIIYPGIYDNLEITTDTSNDTATIQQRYTNEERKNVRNIKETIDRAVVFDSSLINLENEEKPLAPSVFNPQVQLEGLSEEKQKHYQFLWKFIAVNGISYPTLNKGIKEKDLLVWIAKYEGQEIMECLKMTLKAQPTRTWPGYVTKLLKNRIPKKEADSIAGKKMVEEIVTRNKMEHIDLKQDYFVDLLSDDQMYYHINPETIKNFLKRSFDRAKEQEEEKKRESEDNY